MREVNDINCILPHCDKTRTAIQAGGCFGVWAKELSKYYERVFCFEPEEENYDALIKNVGNIDNIILIRAALGDKNGRGSIDRIDPKNIGAHRVKEGDDFDVLALDSIGIDNVDLIQLDVEGCEHLAMLGALKMIKDHSPLICLELKGLGNTYGYADSDTMELMKSIGYAEIKRFHRDVLFKRTNT